MNPQDFNTMGRDELILMLVAATNTADKLKGEMRRLDAWMEENLNMDTVHQRHAGRSTTPVDSAIAVMGDAKSIIESAWPHLQTLFKNVASVLTNAGLLHPVAWQWPIKGPDKAP